MLDIGEGHGALILHTDANLHGVEVEISPTGADGDRQHKEILERSINDTPAFTGVFDKLAAGSYTLWIDDQAEARDISIRGGEISELDWRGR